VFSLRGRFRLQVAAVVVDAIAGTFLGGPTMVMACWMVITIAVAASFDGTTNTAWSHDVDEVLGTHNAGRGT
jgi:hypothetical protein